MKTILVTTDFSANSKAGIRFAIQLASQTPCKLIFYTTLELLSPTFWQKEKTLRFVQNETQKGKQQLGHFLRDIFKNTQNGHLKYEYEVEMGTDVVGMVLKYAQKIKADFICMSTRGAGTLKKLMGTNASALVNTSPIPLIVVPKSYRFKPITKIGYSSDFEKLDSELETVSQLAALFNVDTDVYHFDYHIHGSERKEKLKKFQEKYQGKPFNIYLPKYNMEYTLVENLQRTIKNKKPSILVMFSKSKLNWFERLFFSGFTAGMTFDIKIPLLAYRR